MFFRTLKAILFWGYARNTWQYDVLCALILAFIFLTPKSWFDNSELRYRTEHQNSAVQTRLVVGSDLISDKMSSGEVEQRVRQLTGRPDVKVLAVHPQKDAEGRIVAYEVDMR